MQTKLIHIGNSMGLRLPKSLIKQFNLDKGSIELSIEENGIMIKPATNIPPLKDWNDLFAAAIAAGDAPEKDVFDSLENENDHTEWVW